MSGRKASIMDKSRKVSLRRFTNWRALADANAPELPNDGQYLEFAFPREVLDYCIRTLESGEYFFATQSNAKGVSEAKSFIRAAEQILEAIDKKRYF